MKCNINMFARPSMSMVPSVVLLAGLGIVVARGDNQDEAIKAFESLYGNKYKEVRATVSPQDDVDLAQELLVIAKNSQAQPALAAVLCDRSADLGSAHPLGYAIAVQALELSLKSKPADSAILERIADLRRGQYKASTGADRSKIGEQLIDDLLRLADLAKASGDTKTLVDHHVAAYSTARSIRSYRIDQLQQALQDVRDAQRREVRIAGLIGRLEADPKDTAAADELLRIYVVEMDDLGTAARYAAFASDPNWRKAVPLAAKPMTGLSDAEVLIVADWYVAMADDAGDAHLLMLENARSRFQRFLEIHKDADLERSKAELSLKSVDARIAKLRVATRASSGAPKGWIDLLATVDVKKDALGGKLVVDESGGLLFARTGTSLEDITRFEVPVAISGGYSLKMQLTRVEGDNGFCIVLPVQGRQIRFFLDDNTANGRSGFAVVANKSMYDPTNPASTSGATLVTGRAHEITLLVLVDKPSRGKAHLGFYFDGKKLISWSGPTSDLRTAAGLKWIGKRRPNTIVCYAFDAATQARIESAYLKPEDGSVQLLRK